MTTSLDEYLSRFRDRDRDQRMLEPIALPTGAHRQARGKARAYYLLQEALPPGAFSGVRAAYYRTRRLAARAGGRDRVLPDFMVIGAAKCGTTSLFDWICQHPYVVRPTTDGRARKELLFFDYNFERGIDWYRWHFAREVDRRRFERRHGRPFLTGEATATYLTGHWAPARAAKLMPEVRLIVTLRNPVDRAYSAYQMSRREGLERCESFEGALALEAERLAPEEARVRADPGYNPPLPPPLGYWSYLQRSRYADHAERWLQWFARDQLLFLRFEDLAARPQESLDRVYAFLGLPAHRHDEFRKLNAGDYRAMNSETRAQLMEYFRPYNQRLAGLTGVDFGWDG